LVPGAQATSTQTTFNENGQEFTTTIYKTANPFVNVTYAAVTPVSVNVSVTTTAGTASTSTTTTTTGNKLEIVSRAKILLDRGRATNLPVVVPNTVTTNQVNQSVVWNGAPTPVLASTTNDVLDIAVKKGIKLIPSRKMLDFLNDNVDMPGIQNPSLLTMAGNISGTKHESKVKSVKAIPFTQSYIKVESIDQKHRPSYKVFPTWPELVLDSGTGCPFRVTNIPLEVQKMQQEVKAARRAAEEKSRQMTESRESGLNMMNLNHTPRNPKVDGSGITNTGPSTNNSMYNNLMRANMARGSLSKITPEVNNARDSGKVTPLNTSLPNGNIVRTNGSITTTPKIPGRKDTMQNMTANGTNLSVKRTQQQNPQQTKKKTPAYCEVCDEQFENMQKVSYCCSMQLIQTILLLIT
jgi:hypothetical protein